MDTHKLLSGINNQWVSTYSSLSQLEVDFVIGENVAIEVKTKSRPTKKDLRGLAALAKSSR